MKNSLLNLTRVSSTVLLTVTLLSGCVINIGGHSSADYDGNVSKVFGGIDITENRRVGSLTTVNGNISLRSKVTADELTTVNGGVTIGDYCEVNGITVVNGDIEAGKQFISGRSIESVNGDISLQQGANVDGSLVNVNGDITLTDVTLSGSIETVNGDIRISGNSIVSGDISYNKAEKNTSHSIPTLNIDDSVQLEGDIILEREVELYIPDSMKSKVHYKYTSM